MHRFYLPAAQTKADLLSLSEADAHHAARVLRVQPGEAVTVLDGQGGELRGVIGSVGKRDVTVRVTERRQHPAPACSVTLVQAIAKSAAMDGLIHRAVELGCTRLVPLLADRSVSRPEDAAGKRDKWQAIAIEAMKQSGNPWLMPVELPVTPTAWLQPAPPFELLVIGSLLDEPRHLRVHFEDFLAQHGRLPVSVGALVGPEGDFTPAEYAAFRAAGAKSITLGPLVLRVETAATALLALLQAELTAPRRGGG